MSGHPWWLVALAVVGVLAIGTFFISLFLSLGRRPPRIWAAEVISEVTSSDFLRPLAALLNSPVRRGGRARLLHNGDGMLKAMFADFEAAQRNINIMAYIWEPGKMNDMFMDLLVRRAQEGIEVRVMLDGFGGLRAPDEDIERLEAAGGKVARFRELSFGKVTRFHKRNHRRAIVVDGRIAYTGGMAIGDKWLGDARNEDEWRDTMTRVTGCMAENLQSAFGELWAYSTGEVLTGDDFFPVTYEDEDCDTVSCGVISSPSSEEHPLRLFFFLTFLAARKRLWITTPYFVPDKHTRQAVARRARAGVDVRILMPNQLTDAKPIRQAGHSYYQELLDAGVRLYEYQPTMIHTKHVVVDSFWSVVGSANMDIRSKELNEENVLGIADPGFAREMEDCFLADIERAVEIDAKQWRRRGVKARIVERLCVLFAEQY